MFQQSGIFTRQEPRAQIRAVNRTTSARADRQRDLVRAEWIALRNWEDDGGRLPRSNAAMSRIRSGR